MINFHSQTCCYYVSIFLGKTASAVEWNGTRRGFYSLDTLSVNHDCNIYQIHFHMFVFLGVSPPLCDLPVPLRPISYLRFHPCSG